MPEQNCCKNAMLAERKVCCHVVNAFLSRRELICKKCIFGKKLRESNFLKRSPLVINLGDLSKAKLKRPVILQNLDLTLGYWLAKVQDVILS